MSKISVVGKSRITTTAELLTMTIEFRREDADRQTCVATVAELHNAALALFQAGQKTGSITKLHATGVRSGSFDKWVQSGSESVLTQYASSALTVTYRDIAQLALDTAGLLGNEHTSVSSYVWSLTDETTLSMNRALRRAAIGDAQSRASDYASAAGLTVSGVIQIREPDVSAEPGTPMVRAAQAVMKESAMDSFDGGGSFVDLSPAEIVLETQVIVEFSAEGAA